MLNGGPSNKNREDFQKFMTFVACFMVNAKVDLMHSLNDESRESVTFRKNNKTHFVRTY